MRNLRSRVWNAGMTVIVLAGLLFAPAASAAGPDQGQGVGAQGFQAPDGYIMHGAHLNPVVSYPTEIANFESNTGKGLGIVMYFRPWDHMTHTAGVGPCDDGFLPMMVNGDAKPGVAGKRAIMLTWEPLTPTQSRTTDKDILAIGDPGPASYDNILSGKYDSLITTCATELAAWYNQTFIIRFMHEMNITDSAWWAGQAYNGGDTAKFIQTWRYVWQKFYDAQTTAGHHNVQWLWAPNWGSNPSDSWNAIDNYYPGDAYVDWIGLSGYNWYPFLGYSAPQSYQDLYDGVLTSLQCAHAKPILHAEIGSTNTSAQSKGSWVTNAYASMQTYPLLRAVVWFNDYAYHNTDRPDFRVATTTNPGDFGGSVPFDPKPQGYTNNVNVVTEYKTAVAQPAFTASYDSSKLLNPPMSRCASDVVSTNGVLSARPAARVVARVGQTSVSFQVAALGLSASTTFSISGCPANTTCTFSNSSTTSASKSAPWGGDTLTIQTTGTSALGVVNLTLSGGGQTISLPLTVVDRIYPLYLASMMK